MINVDHKIKYNKFKTQLVYLIIYWSRLLINQQSIIKNTETY